MNQSSLIRSTQLCDELFATMEDIQKRLETRRSSMQQNTVKLLTKKGRFIGSYRKPEPLLSS